MSFEQARKAALDSVVGANLERKDLSPVITMRDGPERPVLQALGVVPAKGLTHYWNEQNLISPGAGAAGYAEGAKPTADSSSPTQLSNTICRLGKVAQVTDTLAAVWTGAGSYELKDGELARMYQNAIDYQTALKTEEVMNEMEWMLCNGDKSNTESFAGGQCDGIFNFITTNVTAYATSNVLDPTANTSGVYDFETAIRGLAKKIRKQYTPTVADLALCTAGQKDGINRFVGGGAGRPLVQVINSGSQGYVGGQEVDEYQTGFFKVAVKIEPQIEIGALAHKSSPPTMANFAMIDTRHFSRADLIKLGAEPLARVNTTVERMITVEFTLEARNEKSSGKITGILS